MRLPDLLPCAPIPTRVYGDTSETILAVRGQAAGFLEASGGIGTGRFGIGGAANIFCRSEKPSPPSVVERDARALSVDSPVLPNAWSMTFDATTNAMRFLRLFKMSDRFQEALRL